MSYCVFECGITYETDFKDTTALYAAITKILSADIRGIEEYWDLDESKRTEEDLKSVHPLMVSAVIDMEWGLDMDIEGLFFDYLTTFKSLMMSMPALKLNALQKELLTLLRLRSIWLRNLLL